jgi:hypothetical protein
MADKYTDGFDNKPSNSLFSTGKVMKSIVAKMEVAAEDADGQTYVLARGLSLSDIVVGIRIPKGFDAITSGTDYDIGLGFIGVDGQVDAVEADVFMNGRNMSAGLATPLDVCESSTTDTIGEALGTDVSTEEAKSNYVIYCIANTVGSAAIDVDFVIDIATSA